MLGVSKRCCWRRWLSIGVLLMVHSGSFLCQALGQLASTTELPPNQMEYLRRIYEFDRWVGRTKSRYERLVTNWIPDFASVGVTNLLSALSLQGFTYYAFRPVDSVSNVIFVTIAERTEVTNAHLALLELVSNSEAPQPFPPGPSAGVDVGDRCYVGWGNSSTGMAFFVRNNVAVSLWVSGNSSILPYAQRFDSDVAARSFTGPVLLQAEVSNGIFFASVPTEPGRKYVLEWKDSLSAGAWTSLPSFPGDGTIRLLTTPATLAPQRYYRLRLE